MKVAATTAVERGVKAELLHWDTEFWGVRIGRTEVAADIVDRWALENTVGLVCLLIDTDEPAAIQDAEERGYRLVDVRVTLDRLTGPASSLVRSHRPEDIAELVRIARGAHRITRFYADPRLPDERCDDLYDSWIRQSCEGWADVVLVAGIVGAPLGYITVHLNDTVASIGLVAVEPGRREKGIGAELVRGAVDYAAAHDRARMSVVTQGRNISAQRVFQACGFRTVKTEVWLHKWYTETGS